MDALSPSKTNASESTEKPLSVSQLTRQIKDRLETEFPAVWVNGEISNLSRPQSGHCYFSLKDEKAQLRAVMWRSAAARLPFDLEDGMEVEARGHLDVYLPRGSYQLVATQIRVAGRGALEQKLLELRERLGKEGLFDPEKKRPLPRFPRRIAVVTSPTGAAIRDFLQVLQRRWQGAQVLILPTRVQGAGSAEEIAAAIRLAGTLQPRPQVIIATRGGGSLEDLWSFNEEAVVRALAESPVPTISAVGHEIDVTLADLAADVRALTPSEAAERILPDQRDILDQLEHYSVRLKSNLRRTVDRLGDRLAQLAGRPCLRRPHESLQARARQLDELDARAQRAITNVQRLQTDRLGHLTSQLESLSPLAVLARGYSVTCREGATKPITRSSDLQPGDMLESRFSRGAVISKVTQVGPDD